MPIDFARIAAMTPQERADTIEKGRREFEERMQATIAARRAQINTAWAMHESNPRFFSNWEVQFLKSMRSRAQSHDPVGRLEGGLLADMGANQLAILNKLAAAVAAANEAAKLGSAPPRAPRQPASTQPASGPTSVAASAVASSRPANQASTQVSGGNPFLRPISSLPSPTAATPRQRG